MSEINPILHSAEHIFAQAISELYPNSIKLAVAHIADKTFANDAEWSIPVSEEMFAKIESRMKEIISADMPITMHEVSVAEAKEMFKNNKFKLEWIEEHSEAGKTLTVFWTGEPGKEGSYVDFCKGPHVKSTGEVKAFKLLSIAGAYWRGDEKNEMLSRVYGTAFGSEKELEEYIWQLEELKKRDHRKLGKEMELFHFDDEIGSGLPIWLPRGNIIKESLENWAKETEEQWGYQRVTTPIITKENLFYTSGHLPLYKDSMYAPIQIEEENFYIKPMNCPFHHKVFSSRQRSYKELPLRVAEYGLCHRYEDSGSLFGLMRVRGMDMNDAHIYVSEEDAVEEFIQVIRLHEYYYKILGIHNYEMVLAIRDPNKLDKYHGEESDWKKAEDMTLRAMKESGVPFRVENEGAAFYGPKMDFQIKSSIGREFTASTNQLDLYMGKQFKLEYTDQDGNVKTPAIIHRAPLGTHERFIGFLIEHFAGAFPVWLHPEQVIILPVSGKHVDYANEVLGKLKENKVRAVMGEINETLGNKIRKAQATKVPYMIIVGDKEVEAKNVSVRTRTGENMNGIEMSEFLERIRSIIIEKGLGL